MKIKVKDIEANPFRDLKRNPVRQDKVDALKSSITDTGFWDNVVVRPHPKKPGKYQVAYGHHRLFAVRDLGIEEIDCPVKNVSDAIMLKMMANENRSEWSSTPATVNEAVWASKQFLDELLDQFDSFAEAEKTAPDYLHPGSPKLNPGNFEKSRAEGVGLPIILAFLGDGWTKGQVELALSALAEDSARAHAARLARRAERAKAKEEAAKLEAERKAKEEEERRAAEEEAKRLAEEAAEKARLAAEAEEKRKAEEAAEKARVEAEREAERARMQAIREAEEAERKAAAAAKAEADRIAAEERRAKLEAQRKEAETQRKAEEERRKAEKVARDAEKAKLQAEAKAAADAKREADRIAKAAKEAREKAEREAKAAEKARVDAEREANKREEQRAAKAKLLADLESEGVDRYAYELFENQAQAGAFRAAVKEFSIPKSRHRDLAQSIVTTLGKEASSIKVTQEVRSFAVLKGYWKERDRMKKMRELLKQETFDTKWRDVGGNLQKAIKDIRFILMQVDKVMGNERELETYDLFELFSEQQACNYVKSKIEEIVPLLGKLNFNEVKGVKDITPQDETPMLEIMQ